MAWVLFTAPALSAESSALVELATVTSGAVNPTVSSFGTVEADPAHTVAISVPRDVVPATVTVRTGQQVRPGDPVASVVTAPGIISAFEQARTAVAFAERDLAHIRNLFSLRLATNSQVDAAVKALADAQAQLQAELRIGADRPAEIIRANTPGIVTAVNASPGQPLQANGVLASIVPRDRLVVILGFEPEDAVHIGAGAPVEFRSPQNPVLLFTGRVAAVDAATDPKTHLVNATTPVPAAVAFRLTVGMVLDGTVRLQARRGLVVPHQALMNDGAGPFVFTVANGIAHKRRITIALSTDAGALVSSGVAAGDRVVVSGNAGLADGTAVRER